MRFEKVGMEKLEDLVKTRIQVLRAANKLDGSADMGQTEQESRTYYEKSLEDGSHVAYLVYDGDRIIGTGGISFYQVMNEGLYHEHVYGPGVQEKRHCHGNTGFAGTGSPGTRHPFHCTGGHRHGTAAV